MDDNGDFKQYRRLILHELEQLNEKSAGLTAKLDALREDLVEKIAEVRNDVTMLKVKAAFVSVAAAAVVSIIVSVIAGALSK